MAVTETVFGNLKEIKWGKIFMMTTQSLTELPGPMTYVYGKPQETITRMTSLLRVDSSRLFIKDDITSSVKIVCQLCVYQGENKAGIDGAKH